MQQPAQARTNHLGYDAGSSRKIPGGVIVVASSAPAKCLESITLSALAFAAVRLPFLVPAFDTVKRALKVSNSTVELPWQLHDKPGPWSSDLRQLEATIEANSAGQLRATMAAFVRQTAAVIATSIAVEAQEMDQAPTFQIQVKVDSTTVMLDAGSAWTAADVKAALHTKIGRASGGYYLVAGGGKPLNDGAATTLAALGVGRGDQLELRGRLRGGMGCGASREPAGPAPLCPLCRPDHINHTPGCAAEKAEWAAERAAKRAETAIKVEAERAARQPWIAEAVRTGKSPPLTAQQQAENEKEVELIAAQLAKDSDWDKVGKYNPNATALKAALADTVLVDAAWLAQLADAGGVLPRCQDLPPGARVTLEEMEKWFDVDTVGVLVISYPWLDADHPDKDGLQLRAISHVLKIFDKKAKEDYGAGCKVGVFFDYVSMPQRSRGSAEDDRTPEELAIFGRSLKGINLWYGHPRTHVLLVDTPLPEGEKTNTQPYAGRGWCVMEFNASGLVKDDSALISLKGLTGKEEDLRDVRKNGKAGREPPVAPAAFASTLEGGVASGATKFTNRGDVGLVGKIYGWAFAAEMAGVVALSYFNLGWDEAQMLTVCAALRAAHAGGGLRKLERLGLNRNKMGDGAIAALAALLEEGAMPNLKVLDLSNNQISDAGMAALASALRGGALFPTTSFGTDINLKDNPGSSAPVDKALASPERKAALSRLSRGACVRCGLMPYGLTVCKCA